MASSTGSLTSTASLVGPADGRAEGPFPAVWRRVTRIRHRPGPQADERVAAGLNSFISRDTAVRSMPDRGSTCSPRRIRRSRSVAVAWPGLAPSSPQS